MVSILLYQSAPLLAVCLSVCGVVCVSMCIYVCMYLCMYIMKQHAFVCIWVDALMGMWIHTDIWV